MRRVIEPELLDELPPADPRARWSRRDLRRINTWMRNHRILSNALRSAANGYVPGRIIDIGAGDGNLMLRVARRISPQWKNVRVTLLDRQKNADTGTVALFGRLGWSAETVEADVFDWANRWEGRVPAGDLQDCKSPGRQSAGAPDVIVANLFLHHFGDSQLRELFRIIASRARLFVAIEPRRASWPLFCCRMLWAIGCNSVTRHDAAVSVRAGFSGHDLSSLWPGEADWQLNERRTGLFSHLFTARRRN